MMEWLWIPAVALLSVFFLALCCYFFSDYTCCPCRRKRNDSSDAVETNDEEAGSVDSSHGAISNLGFEYVDENFDRSSLKEKHNLESRLRITDIKTPLAPIRPVVNEFYDSTIPITKDYFSSPSLTAQMFFTSYQPLIEEFFHSNLNILHSFLTSINNDEAFLNSADMHAGSLFDRNREFLSIFLSSILQIIDSFSESKEQMSEKEVFICAEPIVASFLDSITALVDDFLMSIHQNLHPHSKSNHPLSEEFLKLACPFVESYLLSSQKLLDSILHFNKSFVHNFLNLTQSMDSQFSVNESYGVADNYYLASSDSERTIYDDSCKTLHEKRTFNHSVDYIKTLGSNIRQSEESASLCVYDFDELDQIPNLFKKERIIPTVHDESSFAVGKISTLSALIVDLDIDNLLVKKTNTSNTFSNRPNILDSTNQINDHLSTILQSSSGQYPETLKYRNTKSVQVNDKTKRLYLEKDLKPLMDIILPVPHQNLDSNVHPKLPKSPTQKIRSKRSRPSKQSHYSNKKISNTIKPSIQNSISKEVHPKKGVIGNSSMETVNVNSVSDYIDKKSARSMKDQLFESKVPPNLSKKPLQTKMRRQPNKKFASFRSKKKLGMNSKPASNVNENSFQSMVLLDKNSNSTCLVNNQFLDSNKHLRLSKRYSFKSKQNIKEINQDLRKKLEDISNSSSAIYSSCNHLATDDLSFDVDDTFDISKKKRTHFTSNGFTESLANALLSNGSITFIRKKDIKKIDVNPTKQTIWLPEDIGRYPKSYLPSTVNEAHFNRTNDASHRPSAPLQTPEDSPLIKLKLGDKKLSEIIFKQDNINTLDLHGMTVIEAIYAVQGFIQRQRSIGTPSTKIITGRGIHSTDGEAKLKPAIRNVLMVENLEFYEADKGGSYLIRM